MAVRSRLPPDGTREDDHLDVAFAGGAWVLQRGDSEARWAVSDRRDWIRQTLSPYAECVELAFVPDLRVSEGAQ
jgi:hypothetical protein